MSACVAGNGMASQGNMIDGKDEEGKGKRNLFGGGNARPYIGHLV